jgi:hypothetical protein
MATRVKDVARRSTKKYVEEALYRRLFRKGSTPQAVREELDGFLDSRKRAFKWEVGVCVRRMRRNALYRPALKVWPFLCLSLPSFRDLGLGLVMRRLLMLLDLMMQVGFRKGHNPVRCLLI